MNSLQAEIARQLCELQMVRQRRVHAIAKQRGLTVQQLTLLWHLSKEPEIAMSAIADLMGCDISNITSIADKLEARGWVKRVRNEDRRVKTLELTTQGSQLQRELLDELHHPPPWLDGLTQTEQESLSALLARALQAAGALS